MTAGGAPQGPPTPATVDAAADTAGGLERLPESSRVEAFSDGVFAIVITLLVLDLRPPTTRGAMLRELLHQWPVYVAYLATFSYVGVIWVNHHQLFTRIRRVDGGLLWRNLALLLPTSVLPFPTAVLGNAFQLGNHGDQSAALVFYAVDAGLTAVTWLVLFHYLATHKRLLVDTASASFFALERRRAVIGIVSYVVAALVALWEPVVGLAVSATLPVFYGLTSGGVRAPAARSGSTLPGCEAR